MAKHTMWYACCDVLASALRTDLCWSCDKNTGIAYYEAYGDARIDEQPYRSSSSTIYMQFSKVKIEATKWRHP